MSKQTTTIDADEVARCAHAFYAATVPTGKRPLRTEWTNMAAVLACPRPFSARGLRVLALATGSKCLPEAELPTDGSLVHDSHAEVLARRCFLRLLYYEMKRLQADASYKSEVVVAVTEVPGKFHLREDLDLYLYTSHTPCGDASIIPKKSAKRAGDDEDNTNEAKRPRLEDQETADEVQKKHEEDIHRTGAKCVPGSVVQDAHEKGVNYHVTGVVRTKPGRGESTKCMSCSDKMAKWLVLGLQGSLLSSLLVEPVYLAAVVVGRCPFDEASMRRALIERSKSITGLDEIKGYRLTEPMLLQSTRHVFPDSKLARLEETSGGAVPVNTEEDLDDESGPLRACPTSICWTRAVDQKPLFLLVKGTYQGVTKKSKAKTRPVISKSQFLDDFRRLISRPAELTYAEAKSEAVAPEYARASAAFFAVYSDWLRLDRSKYYQFN